MKILELNEDDWKLARAGIPTASEFGNLVTPLWKIRTGEMVHTYLCEKLAERWLGGPLPSTYGGGAREQGSLREDDAIPWYEGQFARYVRKVGETKFPDGTTRKNKLFVVSDDGTIGCSPDGWFDDNGTGLEAKCPAIHTHVKYLLAGELPEQYRAQVQGSLLITGAESWTFVSYVPLMPALVLTVERDEKAIGALLGALAAFNEQLDEGFARLVQLAGGTPPRRAPPGEPVEKELLDGII